MGFQIAPMIDVVFVIMLFFMVMAGAVKVERELKTSLPGLAPANLDKPQEMPDEIVVSVEETGVVTLNEEEFDTPESKELPNFTSTLLLLKQEADNRGAKVIVTIEAEEQAKYDRVIDVLNSMAKAKISNVTFTVGSDVF
jgi:biopolymer transport protein ExbD